MLKRIHVNKWHIAANRKAGDTRLPAWTIKLGNGRNIRCHAFEIMPAPVDWSMSESKVSSVYAPHNPMRCGAVAWLETRAPIAALNADTDEWEEIR